MEWEVAQKSGMQFQHDGKTFYDLAVGPTTRAVVAGVGILDRRYGFVWYYTPRPAQGRDPGFTHEDAAKVLVSQFRYSLIDLRSFLLSQGKLSNAGEEIGYVNTNRILENTSNAVCSGQRAA